MAGRSPGLGLTIPEYQTLLRITRHPALAPFAIVAGVVGLDAAAECCKTRSLPEEASAALSEATYTVEDLPDERTIAALVTGIRWRHALCTAIKRRVPLPPRVQVAKDLGVSRRELRDGIRVLAGHGWFDPQVAIRREVDAFVGRDPRAHQGA